MQRLIKYPSFGELLFRRVMVNFNCTVLVYSVVYFAETAWRL